MKLFMRLAMTLMLGVIFIIYLIPKKHVPKPLLSLKPSVPIGLLLDTPGCVLPKFEVVSSEVKKIFKHDDKPFDCGGKPQLVESHRSKLVINKRILVDHYETEFARCYYWNVVRDTSKIMEPDDSFVLVVPKGNSFFESEIYPESDVVFVKCNDKYEETFYKNYHAVITDKSTGRKENPNDKATKLNIIVMGIDSVSKLNFLRHFKKTYQLLKSLDSIELNGYNKVEDSTLVNMIPFLTGKYLSHYWNGSEPSFFDHVDQMWRYFSKIGYKTLFAEDFPKIGMFNYQKNGFKKPPTDHYYRPYAESIARSFIKKRSLRFCIDDTLEPIYLLKWVQHFTEVYKDQSFYAFSWSSSVSHDYINSAGYLDDPYHDFIKGLKDSGTLNNTVLVFLSDHGIRFGEILETYVGRFEQRLPFLFVTFPPWFYKTYPNFTRNLQTNQHHLVTPFDLYEMQKDILKMAGGEHLARGMNKSPGISLFKKIPSSRSCETATISPHFCACDEYKSISASNRQVLAAAAFVVEHVNNKTEIERHQCAVFKLKDVHEASSMVHSRVRHNYRIVITLTPGNGLFESTVCYETTSKHFIIEGTVTRINKYGDQSHCTKRSQLKPYCLCSGYH